MIRWWTEQFSFNQEIFAAAIRYKSFLWLYAVARLVLITKAGPGQH